MEPFTFVKFFQVSVLSSTFWSGQSLISHPSRQLQMFDLKKSDVQDFLRDQVRDCSDIKSYLSRVRIRFKVAAYDLGYDN